MRTAEYLTILTNIFGNDLRIEGTEWESEWGTTHYQVTIYLESLVVKMLKGLRDPERLREYEEDGVEACMDIGGVITSDTFDEAIKTFFEFCREEGLLP